MSKTAAGYHEDLAYIHDVGFGDFALQAAPGLLGILRQCGVTQGLVVDLGCGSGLWAHALIRAGYTVVGVDLSAAMLAIARKRVPEARFQRGSFLEVNLPRCEAVTALGEIVNYLFDVANSRDTLLSFFRRVYEALRPGGVFVFDVAEPGRGGGRGRRQKNFEGQDWGILLETEEDLRGATLTRRITSFRRIGKVYRRAVEVHRLRLYKGTEMAIALRRLGFRTRLVRGYGRFRFPRGLVGVIARKP